MYTTKPLKRPRTIRPDQFRRISTDSSKTIHSVTARSQHSVSGRGLCVAVIDSGIRSTHMDFEDRVVGGVNFTGDNNGNFDDYSDGHGHGTHISGVIAANNIHTGIAPKSSIFVVKIVDNVGLSDFSLVERALSYVLDHHRSYGITCVQLSMGDGKNHVMATSFEDHPVSKLIHSLHRLDIPVVCSAGNDFHYYESDQGMTFPAILPQTFSVGSVYNGDFGEMYYSTGALAHSSAADVICPYSQRLHQTVSKNCFTTVFAPGGIIDSSGIANDAASARHDGTSHAAPIVSGAILLLQELHFRFTGKLPKTDVLRRVLLDAAYDIFDGDNEDDNVTNTLETYSRLDVLGALNALRRNLPGEMA